MTSITFEKAAHTGARTILADGKDTGYTWSIQGALMEARDGDSLIGVASTQRELEQQVRKHLATKSVENAVDPVMRINRADELLARMIDDIGTGPALDRLRKDAVRIKHVLRGLDW